MTLLSKDNRGHFSYKPIQPRAERVVVVTPPVRGQIALSSGPAKEPVVVVKKPPVKVPPRTPPKRMSSRVKGYLRAVEHSVKQVTEMTQDHDDGTRSKRDALVRAYVQMIAATKGMERAKYTPESASVRTWLTDIHNAGNRLCTLSKKYTNSADYGGCTNHHEKIRPENSVCAL